VRAQSTVFPMFVRAEYEEGQAFSRFKSEAQRAANQVKQEFKAVGEIIDQALETERTTAGALDLGVSELREAAIAQQQRAIAAREVAEATLRAAQADGEFNMQMRKGVTAARQYAAEQERLASELRDQVAIQDAVQKELNQTVSATGAVIDAQRRGLVAKRDVISTSRAERTAMIQLGQQLQDVTVQTQLGTSATQIFTQQMPQAAFALTGLAGSADKTKARIGEFATFLSGPWGAAVFAGTAILGPFIANLFESGDAANEAAGANQTLADRLDLTRNSFELVIAASRDYNREVARSAETALEAAEAARKQTISNLQQAESMLAVAKATSVLLQGSSPTQSNNPETGIPNSADRRVEALLEQINLFRETLTNNEFDVAIEKASLISDEAKATAEFYKEARQSLRGVLVGDDLIEAITQLNTEEKAALDALKKGTSRLASRTTASDDVKAAQRLIEFADSAAAKVSAIGERFTDIPSEVAKVNRSVSVLDELLKDIDTKASDKNFPEELSKHFAELRLQTQDLRDELSDFGVLDELDRTIDEIRQKGIERLEVERLLLAGRKEEAEVTQIMLRLEQSFGEAALDRREELEDILEMRNTELELQRRLKEEQNAYLGATRGIKQELESLLSGESVDFGRVFRQLRGQVLTEQIFGDAFRRIDATIKGSFDRNADLLEDNVERAGRSFEKVAEEAEMLASRLSDVLPQAGLPAGAPAGAAQSSVFAQFDAVLGRGAANDNGIVVSGKAIKDAQRNTVTGMTPEGYADLLGRELTAPLITLLPEGIASALSPVLSRAVGGALSAGPVGGVLGALDGLFGTDGAISLGGKLGADISKGISGAFAGAQTGQLVAGLSDALGLGLNQTGSMIGGAAGSLLGPVGSIVGSILGGIVGNLFGSKSGSATLGAGAGGLGVTGFSGGSSSRRDAAAELGDAVANTINRLAEQLDANVNSSAASLSIGFRKDDIRVDTSGGGKTKTSNGARNFGEDAEGAILFAVQDLINDGVIEGLSRSENNLLRAGGDLEQAITDVLSFRAVFDRLNGLENPLEQEIVALNREFENLIELFDRANASFEERADLERLYEIERASLFEKATDRVAGSLKDLIDDLTTGDNGLSLRARRNNAIGDFDALTSRVQAGDTSAFDDFEQSARVLLEIERELSGSQQQYFDRYNQVLEISRAAVADQETLLSDAANTGSPFGTDGGADTNPIGLPIMEQTAILEAQLQAINDNLGRLINIQSLSTGGGGSVFGSQISRVSQY